MIARINIILLDRNHLYHDYGAPMQDENRETLHTLRKLKNAESSQERLQGWREIRAAQGLSGEYALAVRLNGKAYTEEEADMVAALFGR